MQSVGNTYNVACLFNVSYFKTTKDEEKEEGLVPACAKVKAYTSCIMRLRAYLELISFCIALRISYNGLEACCWCHLPWKHSWSTAWRQQISETESHSCYFSHGHVWFSGNWALTERKFVWKQRHRSAPTGRKDSCPKAGWPSEPAWDSHALAPTHSVKPWPLGSVCTCTLTSA